MNSWEYVIYYREKIWQYAVLACRAEQFGNHTQLAKYKREMNNLIKGLANIENQERVA